MVNGNVADFKLNSRIPGRLVLNVNAPVIRTQFNKVFKFYVFIYIPLIIKSIYVILKERKLWQDE